MEDYKRLLLNNKAWVIDRLNIQADFFAKMGEGQEPKFLWIGCSDSRVPAEEVTGSGPGEIFVHRNVANLVISTDINVLSVIQYAVEVLEVEHIIVCGHYGCGGVRTALNRTNHGLMNMWLRHIKDVYHTNAEELDAIPDDTLRFERLVELNVLAQVEHLSKISFVQRAWKKRKSPTLHGWIYDVHSGHLKDLIKVEPGQLPHGIYVYDLGDE
ncbi:MAG: carbonic anhydrase [bacterium]|nr:carbonic anhydrase [bacterium]